MTNIETTRQFPSIPFTATLRSEWTKLISVRSTWLTIGVGVLLAIGITIAVAIATGIASSDWSVADQAAFDPVATALSGSLFLLIAFVVLGVRMIASEYASGMMHLTLTATPDRAKVLAAKATILVAVTLTVGAIVTLAQYFGALTVLDGYGVDTSATSGATRAIVATAGLSSFLPLIGLALAVLLRSAAGAISTVPGRQLHNHHVGCAPSRRHSGQCPRLPSGRGKRKRHLQWRACTRGWQSPRSSLGASSCWSPQPRRSSGETHERGVANGPAVDCKRWDAERQRWTDPPVPRRRGGRASPSVAGRTRIDALAPVAELVDAQG